MQDSNEKKTAETTTKSEVKTAAETAAKKATDTKSNAEEKSTEKTGSKKIGRWIEIFAFLLIFAGVLWGMSYLIDPVRLNQPEMAVARDRHVVAALAEEPNSSDVLVVGDSEAMVLVSTKILMDEAGISSYNCNQLGQRTSETYYFLSKLLEEQNPKVMILETNVITQDTTFNTEVHLSYNATMQEVFPIMRYHSNWRRKFGLEEPPEYNAYRGFEEIYVVDPYSGEEYMAETEDRYSVNPIAMFYLDEVRKLCDEKGIEIILVSSPSAINFNYAKHNTMQDYADKYGLEYIDFNLLQDEIGLDWSNDTGDAGDHINVYGTEKTTRYLMNYLNENYDLPDHRED